MIHYIALRLNPFNSKFDTFQNKNTWVMIVSVETVCMEITEQVRTKPVLVFTSKLPCHIVMRIEVNFPDCGGHSTTWADLCFGATDL